MLNYQDFDEVFAFDTQYSYQASAVESILANRERLGGLFIDKIVRLLDIKRPSKSYPPKSNSDLRSLHSTVCASQGLDVYKLSVLYYVLLDYDATTRERPRADDFASSIRLPTGYQMCMKGFWHLDHLQFEIATQYLTHPSLVPAFPDDVLDTLVRHAQHDNFALALAYYHTVRPSLKTTRAIETLFVAICRTSVTEALYFAREQTDIEHKLLFEKLVYTVLHGPVGERTAQRSIELVDLPFTRDEEGWFEAYLTTGEGKTLKKANDTLVMRHFGNGKVAEAMAFNTEGSKTANGLNWRILQDGLQPAPAANFRS